MLALSLTRPALFLLCARTQLSLPVSLTDFVIQLFYKAATVMALNLATSIIERAGLGGEVTGESALGIHQEIQEKMTCEK